MPKFDAAPTLETERLILRAHCLSDFAESAAMWADPGVVRYISGAPSTPEVSWSRLLRYAGHWRLLGFGYWVAEMKASGEFIGEVGFADYRRDALSPPWADGTPEVGWVLKTAQHGNGFASEAVRHALVWADTNLDAPASFCLLDPRHTASVRVARKSGYGSDELASYAGEPALALSRGRYGAALRPHG